jgi:RPA family protein
MEIEATSDREPAIRAFPDELTAAEETFQEDEDEGEENAPQYTLLPTGLGVNRVFGIGTLVEVTNTGGDQAKARIATPAGTFTVLAGQYQEEVRERIREMGENEIAPEFVSIVGKPKPFYDDENDEMVVPIRPENIRIVSREERDKWTREALEETRDRLENEQDSQSRADEVYEDGFAEEVVESIEENVEEDLEIAVTG